MNCHYYCRLVLHFRCYSQLHFELFIVLFVVIFFCTLYFSKLVIFLIRFVILVLHRCTMFCNSSKLKCLTRSLSISPCVFFLHFSSFFSNCVVEQFRAICREQEQTSCKHKRHNSTHRESGNGRKWKWNKENISK